MCGVCCMLCVWYKYGLCHPYCVWSCVVLMCVIPICCSELCIVYGWCAFGVYRWCLCVIYLVNVWYICGMCCICLLCAMYPVRMCYDC